VVALLAGLPLAAPPAEAHVARVGQTTAGGTTDATSFLMAHATPAGSHRVLVAVIHHLDQTGPAIGAQASARYGTLDLTCPPEARSEGAFVDGRRLLVATQVCYLVNPPVGTANLLAMWDQPVASYVVTAASFENAEPGPPGMPSVGAMGQANAVSADPELPLVTDQDDSLIVGGANAKSVEPVKFVALAGTTTIPGSAASASPTPGALDDLRVVSGQRQTAAAGSYLLGWDLQLDPSGAPSTPRDIAIAAIELHTHPDALWDGTSATQGTEAVAAPRVSVALEHRFGAPLKVGFAATGGTAIQGADYSFTGGPCTAAAPCELSVPAGSLSADIPLAIVDDRLFEADETIEITLSSVAGSHVVAPTTWTYTILDDDVDVAFRVAAGNGTETLRFPTVAVDLSRSWTVPILVTYSVKDGRASKPSDYLLANGVLTFPAGNRTQTIPLEIVNDLRDEDPENFTIKLEGATPANANVASPSVFDYTILDDDPEPALTITAVSPVGENAGPAIATVTLSQDSGKNVTVRYTATDGTATGGGVDYTLASGTLRFVPGEISKAIAVALTNDAIDEDDENLTVSLSSPANATLAGSAATIVIDSEDQAGIVLSRTSLAVAEPEPGVPAAPDGYTVRLATQPTEPVRITLTTLGNDATPTVVTLDFTPANWNVPQTVQVVAVDDFIDEADPHNDTLRHAATGDPRYAILAPVDLPVVVDDNDNASVRLSRSALEVSEDGLDDAFTVVLTSQPEGPVTVTVRVFDGQVTADNGSGPGGTVVLGFTPADWMLAQTVLVRAVDDARNETDVHLSSLNFTAASSDPLYHAWPIADLPVQVHDDDEVGVDYSATLLALAEDGTPTATYSVALRSEPAAPVTIWIDVEGGQAEANRTSLVFTPTDWNVPQVVAVQALDDAVDEDDPHADRVLHVATSLDPDYDIPAARAVDLRIADNDQAGILLDPITLAMAEDAAPATHTVRLATQPTAPVTVTVTAEPGLTAAAVLTFTPADWDQPQPVDVQPVDDDRATGDRTLVVTHAATSDDPFYAGRLALLPVDVAEDDAVGVVVLAPALGVTEGGAATSYGVRLASEPAASVTVTVVPDDDPATYLRAERAGSPTLTFTPADWAVPQFVTVWAPDDDVANGAPTTHADLLRHLVASSDLAYDGLPAADVNVTIEDLDQPGVVLAPAGLVAGEDGTTATLQVRLLSEPKAAVTVRLSALGRALLGDDAVTFTPATWRDAIEVQLTVADDAIDQAPRGPSDEADVISATVESTDLAYAGFLPDDLAITLRDDDTSGLVVSRVVIPLAEGGAADTFSIRLATEPTSDVAVSLDVPGDATASPLTLAFTPADWSDPRTVTVAAVDDAVDEDAEAVPLTATAAAADPLYDGLAAGVTLNIADDDTAGLRVAPASVAVTEGEAGVLVRYTLGSEPESTVTVTLAPGARVGVAPAVLTFDASNWQTGLEALVTAPDDDRIRSSPFDSLVTATVAAADPRYAALAPLELPVTVTEDDTAALLLTQTGGRTTATENSTAYDMYTLALQTIPDADVAVDILADAEVEVSLDGTAWASSLALTFDSMAPQTVYVRAVDDADAEGSHTGALLHTLSTTDPNYALAPRGLAVVITDDDAPGIDIQEIDGATEVAEAGTTTDAYTVALTTRPTDDVTIAITPALAGQLDIWPPFLTFTPADWRTPQTVAVTALQDLVDEAEAPLALHHGASSNDAGYDGLAGNDVDVTILDDDEAGIEMAAALSVVEGGTVLHRVRLASEPTASVSVTFTSGPEAAVPPTALVFTAGDWSIWQEVAVAGRPDDIDDGDATATLTATASSADAAYEGLQATTTVTVLDDDEAGVQVSPSGTALVAEGGAGTTLSIVLGTRPSSAVRITIATNGQATATASITFGVGTWNVPQTITINAAADNVAEGLHADALRFTVASNDGLYDGFTLADVPIAITDDDVAALLLEPVAGGATVAEGGATDTYRVRLGSQPAAAVTVSFSPDAQLAGLPASVIIPPASWSTGALVTVGAAQDLRVEGNHTGIVGHATASGDPNYAGLAASLTVAVQDDDAAGLLVAETGADTRAVEGGASDTIELRLASEHDAAVTVTIAGGPQVALVPGTVTFAAGDLGPKTIQVAAVDDPDREGPHGASLSFTLTGDALYAGLAAPELAVVLQDNDVPGVQVAPTALALAEAGATAGSYTVVLDTRPSGTVQVDVLPDVAGQVVVSPGVLVFTVSDWNVPRTVTVTAVDDPDAEGPHGLAIDHAPRTTDADYRLFPIPQVGVALADNDEPALLLGPAPSLVEGGATGSFTVRLATRPASDTLLGITLGGVTAVPGDLVFTRANWDTPRTVTLTAIDDPDFEGPHAGLVRYTAVGDARYAGLVAELAPAITDNDVPALVGTPVPLVVGEAGGNDTIQFRLGSRPRAAVDVALTGSQVVSGTAALRFLPTNWDQPQAVAVAAVDDGDVEGTPHAGLLTAALSSTDPAYGFTATFAAQVTDNDAPGLEFLETDRATEVAEDGATDTYGVRLAAAPTAEVVVVVAGDAQATAAPATLRFTPSDWQVAQDVTVSAVDDAVQEAPSHLAFLTHTVTAGDAGYLALAARVLPATVRDDDVAAVRVVEPGGSTNVLEDGATDSYTIALASQPTAAVTVRVFGDAQAGASPAVLTFTAADWSVPQTVTVSARHDDIVEGDHAGRLFHTVASADGFYDGLPAADVLAGITDDDAPGVFLAETGSATAVAEDGATTDSYTVVLTKAPVADVVATMALDAAQATVAPATLRFTAANWDQPQAVTVTAVDDDRADGDGPFPLTHALTGDAAYAGLPVRALAVAVADDDTVGLVVVEGPLGTIADEGGAGGRYHLRLTSRPAADVVVTITGDAQATATATVRIRAADWDLLHPVDVAAVNDALDEEDLHPALLMQRITSADPAYGLPDLPVPVLVRDDDAMPTIGFVRAATESLEDQGEARVEVRLSAVSGRNVTVQVARVGGTALAGTDHGFAGATLTIPAGQRNATFAIPITADTEPEPDESILIALESPVHATLGAAAATHWIDTDDLPGITVTGLASVREGGNATTLMVRLPAAPAGTVTIRVQLAEHWQLSAGPVLLTFTPADWSTPQPVTLVAVEDLSPDGDTTVVVVFEVVPGLTSPEYRRAGSTAVPVAVLDRLNSPGLGAGPPVASIFSGGGSDTPTVIRKPAPPPVRPPPRGTVVLEREAVADHDITDRLEFRADGGPVLEWSAYQGAVGYQVWRDTGRGWELLATTSGNRIDAGDLVRPGDRVKLTFHVGFGAADGLVADGVAAAELRGWDDGEALTVPDYMPGERGHDAARHLGEDAFQWGLLLLLLLAILVVAGLEWRRRSRKGSRKAA
jgi:hypothetical protein